MKRKLWILVLVAFAVVSAGTAFAAGTLARGDQKFFTEAANGGMMEVQLGQMAQKQAQSQDVKSFGERMVTDHTKANDELKTLAQQKDLAMPSAMEHKMKKAMDKLSGMSGADFDRKYMEMMVKDHTKDVADFRKAAKNVKDADLNAWAKKTLPTLEDHLKQAKETAQKLGLKTKK